MIATGKHFPGHGDTDVNSHLALPTVNVSRARLDSVELVPFRAAIAGGLGAMMSFHGAMPALDSSGAPGTLSANVLTGLLREEMGFAGIIISDAMDMRGVLDRYGAAEATKRAVVAGADILIQPEDIEETLKALVGGVREGRYPESRLNASARRILEAKHRLALDRNRLVFIDSVRSIVDDSTHRSIARRVAERSITLVKDSLGLVPLREALERRGPQGGPRRVLSVTVARRFDLAAGGAFDGELRRTVAAGNTGTTVRSEYVNAEGLGTEFDRLLLAADSADVVVVSSYMTQSWNASTASAPRAFTEFVRGVTKRGRPLVLVSFGNPYLLRQVPEVPGYLVAWGGFPVSQVAAARALSGAAAISGRLPISIPPVARRGAGLARGATR
jgi:beta-N-acetylhexosaminidase